jgi:eukaryotic-like serine/threonine-protein kinase
MPAVVGWLVVVRATAIALAMAPFPSKVGRYEIIRPLGRGAMGAVFLARDPLIARSVAVKMLPPLSEDPAHMQRLLAEARIAGGLDHPNIVRVFDVGEDDGQPFVVMQHVEGRTLAAVLADPSRPTLDTKLGWMVQLCEGLAHAHEHRVIHRDLKPSNLMIDVRGALRILDFGVAKIVSTSQIKFTSIGTPAYMAPEQYSKAPVDPRTDIFAAGLVLFELITHARALEGDSPAEILGQLMRGEIRRLADAAPGVDAGLAAICDRATASDPGARFQTASVMGAALADARHRLSSPTVVEPLITRPPVPPPAAPTASTILDDAFTPVPIAPPAAPRAFRWKVAAGLAAGAAILVVLVASGMFRTGSGSGASPPAAPPASGASAGPATPDPTPPGSSLASPPRSSTEPPKTDPPPEDVPAAPVIGRLRVTSDLDEAVFNATPVRGRGVIALTRRSDNVLSPARYEVRASYVDRDPNMGAPDATTTTRLSVDVVAGRTATAHLPLETLLWRDRFERALVRPAGQRAAVLDRTYRRLKELSSTTPTDETRYNTAAAEQQIVEFAKGDLATDIGLEKHVQFTKVDLFDVDNVRTLFSLLGGEVRRQELTRGRHDFSLRVEFLYGGEPAQSMACAGAFDVPGGVAALPSKVHVLIRRPPKRDGRVAVECQVGGASRLVPSPPTPSGPVRSTLAVRVQSQGRPVAGATVALTGGQPQQASQRSDDNGLATFRGLGAGDHVLDVTAIGYRRVTMLVDIDEASEGRVVDLQAPVGKATADEHGRFVLRVDPGRYDVLVQMAGFAQTWFENVVVSASRGAQLNVRLRPGTLYETFRDKPKGIDQGTLLAGTVLDGRGAPLKGAVIVVLPARQSAAPR